MSEVVSNLLSSKGISYTFSGKDYLIKCLNPEHDDSNPSCRVDRETGVFHCFACGWKGSLFRHFGLLTTHNVSIRVSKLKRKLDELKNMSLEVDYPEGHIPYTQVFRGISVKTLKEFGAFYTHSVERLKDRIVFPIKDISGKTVSFIGRHVSSSGSPRYEISPSGRPVPPYPVKMPTGSKSIVIVEGIFDMLNLYDKGLHNVVCMFGVSTVTKDTAEQLFLPYKIQGITHIYIAFDGDEAGQKAATTIKPWLEEQLFTVEIIEVEEETDPGDMSQEVVDAIRKYINDENSSN